MTPTGYPRAEVIGDDLILSGDVLAFRSIIEWFGDIGVHKAVHMPVELLDAAFEFDRRMSVTVNVPMAEITNEAPSFLTDGLAAFLQRFGDA